MAETSGPAGQPDLATAVQGARVLVTTGAGGVGKTTVAAALGVAAARAGRRCLVMTIDPARRLAQSMGLKGLGPEPQPVDLSATDLAEADPAAADPEAGDGPGAEVSDPGGRGSDDPGAGPAGHLEAMMLDMQSTFDDLIDRHAGSRSKAEAIKSNRIYRTLSSTLSGTHEYMAMEKPHELQGRGEWDLLIVDTPPTRSALDFLEAPRRMTSFLEGRLLKALMRPGLAAGRRSLKMFNFGATAFMRVAGKVTGMGLLEDLAAFFRSFEGMYEGFKERAEQVLALLQDPLSRFVVVTSPQPPPLREARYFLERLEQEGLHLAGVVVNRIHPELTAPDDEVLLAAAGEQDDDTEGRAVAGALRLLADVRNLAERERREVARALYGLRVDTVYEVPLLATDVHDLESLATVSAALTGPDARTPV